MTTRTKKVKASGRFGVGFGIKIKKRLNLIEEKQRKRQTCPFCKKPGIKRLEKGIWKCSKCDKKFASNVFVVD